MSNDPRIAVVAKALSAPVGWADMSYPDKLWRMEQAERVLAALDAEAAEYPSLVDEGRP